MVRVVSPNAPYPVPTLFHLVPTVLDHLDLINGILVHFDPFLTQKGVLGVQKKFEDVPKWNIRVLTQIDAKNKKKSKKSTTFSGPPLPLPVNALCSVVAVSP